MSGPFTPVTNQGTPLWGIIVPANGNFAPITVLGVATFEVGYGDGGFGDDGYDTPGTPLQAAGTPNWTVEVVR